MSAKFGTIRHVIFDNDGVLIDSEDISMRIDQQLLAGQGIVMSHAELTRRFVGKTFRAMMAEMEAERGSQFPADLEAQKDVLMIAAYRRNLQPVPGVVAALDAIALPKSVASNGPRDRIDIAFEITGLAKYFEGRISTFEQVKAGKPAPDIYLLAADRAGCEPAECLVIEDSPTGVTAAHAAGCRVLGFTGTAADKEIHAKTLRGLGAFAVFDDMTELPLLLA
ncbi:HAD family hydrolase [soil metagenome]